MKLLFTGASGFLGKNIIPQLTKMGYNISTLGRHNSEILCDLSISIPTFSKYFETILHAAGKAHSTPKSEKEEQSFFEVNLTGTQNLCLGLQKSNQIPQNFIYLSTAAVYGLEKGVKINENQATNGTSPYAKSKILAESFLTEWCKTNNVKLSILRPSLIAGTNPPGNLGAMIKGIESGRYLSIDGGKAKKSVLMAIDIAHLIPLLEQNDGGTFNICDNHHPTFRELEIIIANQLGKTKPINIPLWLAKTFAFFGDFLGEKAPINSEKLRKIITPLTFDNTKAKELLGWQSVDVVTNFKIKE